MHIDFFMDPLLERKTSMIHLFTPLRTATISRKEKAAEAIARMTPAERIEFAWALTCAEHGGLEQDDERDEPRLCRDVARVERCGR